MKEYLAKSNPPETIQEHTDNLLKNLDILKNTYPNIKANWKLLELACLYHDLGKINEKFQNKLRTGRRTEGEIPHAFLSTAFINTKRLKESFETDEIKALITAIAFHHDRQVSDKSVIKEQIPNLSLQISEFSYSKIREIELDVPGGKYFSNTKPYSTESHFYIYLMIKGLLNKIDYAASAHEDVEVKNDFLLNLLAGKLAEFRKENPQTDWNPLQLYMKDNTEKNLIVIAQTGMGKTEAGLLWIGDSKGFFTLPLKTAINSIYSRITSDLSPQLRSKIGLLHSETYNEYLEYDNKSKNTIDIDRYYTKTRQLSLPLTICTLDQIFDFVYKYNGFEIKPATLSYSKVVIDEIQMYSPNLIGYIIYGLDYITKLGSKFSILTATFPPFLYDFIRSYNIEFESPSPFINDNIRHSLKVIPEIINSDFIVSKFDNNKVLVICNTVREAQRIYKELQDKIISSVNLFHSGFIKKDRKAIEKQILHDGNIKTQTSGIWICTQVAEASLDLDFDILITELSDLNGLFQRMGRCYRNRLFNDEGYNCFIFTGGTKYNSGVGNFIDKEIFKLSKQALIKDGPINESEKLELINSVYTTEKLKNTEYYRKIECTLNYLENLYEFELDRKKVVTIFRDINSFTVIPKVVYLENKEFIDSQINILTNPLSEFLSEKEHRILKQNKVIAKNKILDFTVSIPAYVIYEESLIYDMLSISKYESLRIVDIDYSVKTGINTARKKDSDSRIDIPDKFF